MRNGVPVKFSNCLVGCFCNDIKFDTLVCEELHGPCGSSFRRRGTGEFDELGFGSSIEDGLDGWSCTFFGFESGFESFFDESFSDICNGIVMTMKLFGDFLIGDTSIFCFIDGEQDIGVFDFFCVGFSSEDERF